MTEQIPDTCMFERRLWDIEELDGNVQVIPSNSVLGISTTTQSTANWSGRIDHFLVHHNLLYLFKVSVHLSKGWAHHVPRGVRREIIIRTERTEWHDVVGTRTRFVHNKLVNFIFDDLLVHFTGTMRLVGPSIQQWELPQAGFQDEDLCHSEGMVLTFHSGEIQEARESDI